MIYFEKEKSIIIGVLYVVLYLANIYFFSVKLFGKEQILMFSSET